MRLLEERIEINAPAELVWELLADFGGVARWARSMRASNILGAQATGVGARRAMRHAWGFQFQEQITQWHEGKGFSFDVLKAPYPMAEVRETWALGGNSQSSVVETQVHYRMKLGSLGTALDALLVRFIVRREMREGLQGLRELAERAAPSYSPGKSNPS